MEGYVCQRFWNRQAGMLSWKLCRSGKRQGTRRKECDRGDRGCAGNYRRPESGERKGEEIACEGDERWWLVNGFIRVPCI